MSTSKVIFVSGFGIFKDHEERNASWEAVKLLPDRLEVKGEAYTIKKLEIPVVYDAVDAHVDRIWTENPLLVIHVGVHGKISKITLEKCSRTTGYCKIDFSGKCLPCDKIKLANCTCEEELHTDLPVDSIVERLNSREKGNKFAVSCDVGNYLCGYIYAKSLDMASKRTLFVHVPKVDCPYSSVEVRDAIVDIIGECLEKL